MKKLEKNWKRWKENKQIDKSKYLKIIEEKMEEENEKIRRRDWRIGHFSGGEILKGSNVKIKESRLDLFYFSFHFYFIFDIFFYFLFLEQLGLGLIGHAVISVTT